MNKVKIRIVLAVVLMTFMKLVTVEARAEQSYTEMLRERIKKDDTEKAEKKADDKTEKSDSNESYSEQIKRQLREKDAEKPTSEKSYSGKSYEKSYIEELQEKNPDLRPKSDSENYSGRQKDKVVPERKSSIESIKSGKSDALVLKRPGTPRFTLGFRLETVGTRDYTTDSDTGGAAFNDVYTGKWRPDLHVNLEYQLLRQESLGSIGLFAETGVASFVGKGQFPFAKGNFGSNSQTEFRIYTVPAFVGVTFRLSALKYFQPYASVGGGALFFWETRDDDKDAVRAYTLGAMGSGGVNILLDWISDRASWALYDSLGIKHYFLNLDATYMNVTKGPVQHTSTLFFVGFSFEI